MNFDVDPEATLEGVRGLIEADRPDLAAQGTLTFWFKGKVLTDDETTIRDIGYNEGDLLVARIPRPEEAAKKKGTLEGWPGVAPTAGLHAVQIEVCGCENEKTNGVYSPAAPQFGKPAWYKAASGDEEMAAEGEEPKSKDRGERAIFYSAKNSRWYANDELLDAGFTYVASTGESGMPPVGGWAKGASIAFRSDAAGGDINFAGVLTGLAKLGRAEWADQEVCYATMLKVLGNIAANPGEAKFCSLKIENAAIQNKILKFDGARGFLEAIGFREDAGALVLPPERGPQAAAGRDVLQAHANEEQVRQIRKERHAKAADEAKKEAAKPKPRVYGGDDGEGGGRQIGRGPMRGGGG